MVILSFIIFINSCVLLPINCGNRNDISAIRLTEIGQFGKLRKARDGVPAHFHTGIDIMRPGKNYSNEPISPVAEGKVISKRTDGPYAQIIVEHNLNSLIFWSLYEHISGIVVSVGDIVSPSKPIARFMNREELNVFGWQFDHFHFEILKIKPLPIKPDFKNQERFFNSYSLTCYTPEDLEKYYYDPLEFMRNNLHK